MQKMTTTPSTDNAYDFDQLILFLKLLEAYARMVGGDNPTKPWIGAHTIKIDDQNNNVQYTDNFRASTFDPKNNMPPPWYNPDMELTTYFLFKKQNNNEETEILAMINVRHGKPWFMTLHKSPNNPIIFQL